MENITEQLSPFDPLMLDLLFLLIVMGAGYFLFNLVDLWREKKKGEND